TPMPPFSMASIIPLATRQRNDGHKNGAAKRFRLRSANHIRLAHFTHSRFKGNDDLKSSLPHRGVVHSGNLGIGGMPVTA
ncbi:MAG: hypothetical protein ABF489_08000, partial [Bifidobacterium sp.]|uniref:hypothetical protein n=1 Tax=Bifidobacterium sp. TaxID=41200 RepID=UPI0039EBBA5A